MHNPAIHNIERSRLEDELVEPVDFVSFPLGNQKEAGDGAAQIQQGVDLDGGLGGAKSRPGKEAQTQVDGGGVQGVSGGVEFHGEVVVSIELARSSNQHGGEVGVDAPVAPLVGIGQGAAAHPPANPQVIEMLGTRTQANFQIAQTLPKGQLPKGHAHKLVPTGKLPHPMIALMRGHDTAKVAVGQMIEKLGKDNASIVHPPNLSSHTGSTSPSQIQIAASYFPSQVPLF